MSYFTPDTNRYGKQRRRRTDSSIGCGSVLLRLILFFAICAAIALFARSAFAEVPHWTLLQSDSAADVYFETAPASTIFLMGPRSNASTVADLFLKIRRKSISGDYDLTIHIHAQVLCLPGKLPSQVALLSMRAVQPNGYVESDGYLGTFEHVTPGTMMADAVRAACAYAWRDPVLSAPAPPH